MQQLDLQTDLPPPKKEVTRATIRFFLSGSVEEVSNAAGYHQPHFTRLMRSQNGSSHGAKLKSTASKLGLLPEVLVTLLKVRSQWGRSLPSDEQVDLLVQAQENIEAFYASYRIEQSKTP